MAGRRVSAGARGAEGARLLGAAWRPRTVWRARRVALAAERAIGDTAWPIRDAAAQTGLLRPSCVRLAREWGSAVLVVCGRRRLVGRDPRCTGFSGGACAERGSTGGLGNPPDR